MVTIVISAIVLALSIVSECQGVQKRFFLDVDGRQYLKEECILCKCYQECHAGLVHLSDDDLCKDYSKSIHCNDINRCTCCNDLFLFPACKNGGTCRNHRHGNYTCDCPPGRTGLKCDLSVPEQQTDHCASTPCQHRGACTNNQTGYVCKCPRGWTGHNCEIDIDECASANLCQNGGTCTNTQGSFRCKCMAGWAGHACQIDSFLACNHACTLEVVAKAQPVGNTNASLCPGTSSRSSNEALPMQCCGAGEFNAWHRGLKIMSHCNDIPPYTPISAFNHTKPIPGTAGVFTTCLPNGDGFKMITQECNTTPKLFQVDGKTDKNLFNYFALF